TTLDLYRTAAELADLAVPELADRIVIDLLDQVLQGEDLPRADSGALRFRRVAVRDTSTTGAQVNFEVGDLYAVPPTSATASLIRRGNVLLAQNPAEMTRKIAFEPGNVKTLLARGVHTCMAVPLIARGVTLGVAAFSRAEQPD